MTESCTGGLASRLDGKELTSNDFVVDGCRLEVSQLVVIQFAFVGSATEVIDTFLNSVTFSGSFT